MATRLLSPYFSLLIKHSAPCLKVTKLKATPLYTSFYGLKNNMPIPVKENTALTKKNAARFLQTFVEQGLVCKNEKVSIEYIENKSGETVTTLRPLANLARHPGPLCGYKFRISLLPDITSKQAHKAIRDINKSILPFCVLSGGHFTPLILTIYVKNNPR